MKTIKYFPMIALLSAFIMLNTSCKKEEEEEEAPEIFFKTGSEYIATDATVDAGSTVKIGIEAEVREAKDPIVKFNISKSVNGGSISSVYNEDLSTDEYEYDYVYSIDSASAGNTEKLTFTVTNRDGLTGQRSLTLTIE